VLIEVDEQADGWWFRGHFLRCVPVIRPGWLPGVNADRSVPDNASTRPSRSTPKGGGVSLRVTHGVSASRRGLVTYNQMVVRSTDDQLVDRVFQALADPTRRDIVRRALAGEHSVTSLAGRYAMSFAAVQKHVAVLDRAGLVSKRRRGREQLVRSNIDTVREVARLLDELEGLWRARIDRLDVVLASHTDPPTRPERNPGS
jgi:DNA-binding transcriptional ArsR family regulator